MEKIYLYINETASYDLGQLVIDGYEEADDEASVASVQDIRHQLVGQKRLLALNLHSADELEPWGADGEHLVLAEGVFCWDQSVHDYVLV